MKRFGLLYVAVLCWVQAGIAAEEPLPQMSLWIEGIETESDERIVCKALSEVPNIKIVYGREGNVLKVEAISLQGAKWDLGDLTQAVAKANALDGPKNPRVFLVLKCEGGSQVVTALSSNLQDVCSKLAGVEGRQCAATKEKRALIKLSERGGAKWSEIKAALPGWSPDN